jgi:hypothetical protein
MSLETQLREILSRPGILPADPADAIYGSILKGRCKALVVGEYADNSYLQTFSFLAKDPTAPIAKKETGSGYYRRPEQQVTLRSEPPALNDDAAQQGLAGRDTQPEEKFRAFYFRYLKLDDSFPVHIEHTAAVRRQAGVNKWKFPDLVILDWDVGESGDEGVYQLNNTALLVKQALGEQPFRLTSVELKVDLSLSTLREYFFQCVSNSMWAHSASLVIACSITDSLLADELRRLGTSYGIAVSSFGFDRQTLNSLPPASTMMEMSDLEFDELVGSRSPIKLTSGVPRPALDWDHIRDLNAQSSEFASVFDWIAYCLNEGKAYAIEKYRQLVAIQRAPG